MWVLDKPTTTHQKKKKNEEDKPTTELHRNKKLQRLLWSLHDSSVSQIVCSWLVVFSQSYNRT